MENRYTMQMVLQGGKLMQNNSIEDLLAKTKDAPKITCPKCNTPKWYHFTVPSMGINNIVHCMCSCEAAAYDKKQEEDELKSARKNNEDNIALSSISGKQLKMTERALNYDYFESSDLQFRISKAFVDLEKDIKAGRGYIFTGVSEAGKTHISTALVLQALDKGKSAEFQNVPSLMTALTFNLKTSSIVAKLNNVDLLVLDDIGVEITNEKNHQLLMTIIGDRELKGKSTIITTNLTVDKLKDHLSVRGVSRLLRKNKIITIIRSQSKLMGYKEKQSVVKT